MDNAPTTPHPNGYSVTIRRNSDGTERTTIEEYQFNQYMWEDGNYSCDCRSLMFARINSENPDLADSPCGNCWYSVKITSLDEEDLYSDYGKIRD